MITREKILSKLTKLLEDKNNNLINKMLDLLSTVPRQKTREELENDLKLLLFTYAIKDLKTPLNETYHAIENLIGTLTSLANFIGHFTSHYHKAVSQATLNLVIFYGQVKWLTHALTLTSKHYLHALDDRSVATLEELIQPIVTTENEPNPLHLKTLGDILEPILSSKPQSLEIKAIQPKEPLQRKILFHHIETAMPLYVKDAETKGFFGKEQDIFLKKKLRVATRVYKALDQLPPETLAKMPTLNVRADTGIDAYENYFNSLKAWVENRSEPPSLLMRTDSNLTDSVSSSTLLSQPIIEITAPTSLSIPASLPSKVLSEEPQEIVLKRKREIKLVESTLDEASENANVLIRELLLHSETQIKNLNTLFPDAEKIIQSCHNASYTELWKTFPLLAKIFDDIQKQYITAQHEDTLAVLQLISALQSVVELRLILLDNKEQTILLPEINYQIQNTNSVGQWAQQAIKQTEKQSLHAPFSPRMVTITDTDPLLPTPQNPAVKNKWSLLKRQSLIGTGITLLMLGGFCVLTGGLPLFIAGSFVLTSLVWISSGVLLPLLFTLGKVLKEKIFSCKKAERPSTSPKENNEKPPIALKPLSSKKETIQFEYLPSTQDFYTLIKNFLLPEDKNEEAAVDLFFKSECGNVPDEIHLLRTKLQEFKDRPDLFLAYTKTLSKPTSSSQAPRFFAVNKSNLSTLFLTLLNNAANKTLGTQYSQLEALIKEIKSGEHFHSKRERVSP